MHSSHLPNAQHCCSVGTGMINKDPDWQAPDADPTPGSGSATHCCCGGWLPVYSNRSSNMQRPHWRSDQGRPGCSRRVKWGSRRSKAGRKASRWVEKRACTTSPTLLRMYTSSSSSSSRCSSTPGTQGVVLVSVLRNRNVHPRSRIRLFPIPDTGSEFFPIPDPESTSNKLSILTQKNCFLSSSSSSRCSSTPGTQGVVLV